MTNFNKINNNESYIANFIRLTSWLIEKKLEKWLEQKRKDIGLTQPQLAHTTGINKTTISEIKNGRFTGSFDIFELLIDAVELTF